MKVLLFCAKGFETMEFSPFIDVFGWAANDFGCNVQVVTCGFERQVASAFGVPVLVDRLLSEVSAEGFAALAVPGGFEEYGFYEEAYDSRFLRLIQEFRRQGKPVAAVCVGALPLGKSGILKGIRAATYHLGNGRRQRQLAEFGARVADERVVAEDGIITSRCPETAADVAFALLGMLAGPKMAETVRQAMGYRAEM
ncbi:DJ-1/PfpI family protein [Acutalibacter sp. 1XD8-33]|uniref:DJ-1/PfpI family protein n=1 Tax=Acutalibacter sp. 1XD8-33 TaxID=2320081 RepID=UPI000EA0A63B|nr:DJ-1/PfpI family protein [Acutalibacter sp. 1XD8-33]RKJ40791.1 DJ-1/PfpI family protein [Acutalibacter sp. 1XD8-33]